jgi:voltage-gated potassium channel
MKNDEKNPKMSTSFIAAAGALIIVLVLGTISYHSLEDWTWIQALYFTTATIATVGYGDLAPTNDVSRLFTVFFILIGVSITVSAVAYVGNKFLSRREKRIMRRRGIGGEEIYEKED